MTEPRFETVKTSLYSRKEGKRLEREIIVRKCDEPNCEDNGALYHFPGKRAYCSAHRHLGEME